MKTPGTIPYKILRYSAAFLMLVYGLAKLNGGQFFILDSELDKPLGDVSGFWLTWYYFGFSPILLAATALAEIGGAVLLLFRRTALAGACMLVPVVMTIILIDISFQISLGATAIAIYVLFALLGILFAHREELLDTFWRRQNASSVALSPVKNISKWAVRVLVIALAVGLTSYRGDSLRAPTPVNGAWQVNSVEHATGVMPVAIYFEHNLRWLCVFRLPDGSFHAHDFEVDGSKKTMIIAKDRASANANKRAPSAVLFSGSYELVGSELTLTGKFAGSSEESVIHMTRKAPHEHMFNYTW